MTRTRAVVGTNGVSSMVKSVEAPDRVAVMMAEPVAVTVLADMGKVAEVESAGTVTEAGTVNRALLVDRATRAPPVAAAVPRVTVQVAEPLEVSESGSQERLGATVPASRPMEKVTEELDRDAVMTAVLSAAMLEAVAVKLAEVAPAATVTEAGTISVGLSSERETTAPPVEAALLRVTVQVAEALEVSEAGLQERLVGTVLVSRPMEKVTEEPESDAVMTAVLLVVIVEAVAEKVAEVAPAATVTEAGTVNMPLLSDKETTAPPDGAAPLRLTVQVDVPEPEMLLGLQLSPDRGVVVGGIVTVPVVPRDVMKSPAEEEAKLLLTSTVLVRLVPVDSVRVALATMPFGIAVEFAPASRHVTVPDTELQ